MAADIDNLLHSHRAPDDRDPVDAALAASGALFSLAARSVADALEVVNLRQYTTLTALAGSPKTLDELARHPDAVVGELDGLIAAGWVTSSGALSRTRREPGFELTPHGVQLIAQINARRQAELARVVEGMSPTDRQAVAHAFTIFADAAGDPPEGTPSWGLHP